MAGAPFPLGFFRETLIKSTGEAHEELAALVDRTTQHVDEVLENIRAFARNAQNGFVVPKTPKTRPCVGARKKTSTGSASGQQRATRSTAKAAKRSSAKRVSSRASSEDPEKENIGVVQPRASTRTRGKKGVSAVKLEAVTPTENTPARTTRQRQPLQAQHLTRSQTKALAVNSTPCTPPPKRGNVARGLLASPAARQTPPKQLFSPYAKCSVQQKAKAFESHEAITPARTPASTNRKTTQAQKRTKATAALEPVTPVPPAPEPKASTNEAAVDVEVVSPPPPTKRRVTRQTASGLGKRAVSSSAAASEGAGEEANLAPCTPEPVQPPEKKRITRSSAAALPSSSHAGQDPGPSGQGKADDSSVITLSSSPSVIGSSSDDEEWMSPPTSPKRAKLAPIQQPRSALGAAKKNGGAPAGSSKALAKGRPVVTVVRKLSAKYPMFRSTNPATPKHGATPKRGATPSKPGRPVGASDKRPGSAKHFGLDDSKRHDRSSSSSDVEQNRKQEILRQKMDSAKRDREQRLARVHAQRQRREEERLKNELQRQRLAEQKEQERLKQRAAFHQRKQSERSLHADTLAAASKRKAESPLPSVSKKAIILKPMKPPTPRAARNACPDAEAARLIFGQPSTSLSQKAKLNNSLQQQAMLNSLSQSLRSQASMLPSPERPQAASAARTVTELVEASQEKPPTVLNATFAVSAADQSARPLDQTFTMPAAAAPDEPKTPSPANATFVKPNGGPPKCSGYDITPHRSELPPEPNKTKDNYDIHDLNSGDETDDDEQPRKQVPLWAKGPSLNKLLVRQAEWSIDGLEMFGGMPLLLLDKIFKEKKRYFNKRTSSAMWD